MKKKAELSEISVTTYLTQILMKIGYTGIEDESEVVIFDPSTVDVIVISRNPLVKKFKRNS